MANIYTGAVRPWDSLTTEQQESGEWIKVPDGTEGGSARPRSLLDDVFAITQDIAPTARSVFSCAPKPARQFDATGKPRA